MAGGCAVEGADPAVLLLVEACAPAAVRGGGGRAVLAVIWMYACVGGSVVGLPVARERASARDELE